MTRTLPLAISLFLPCGIATAQQSVDYPDYEDPYDDELLYVHTLINYSFDLEWQLEWERRLLADNALRLNVGSVTSSELQTIADVNVNHELNDKWRLQARAFRNETRLQQSGTDEIFIGFERSIFESSAVFLMGTPQYEKEFMDVYAGYTFYRDNREQYLRVGLLFEDLVYDTKNDYGGTYEQEPVALQWALRLGGERWWIFSEGKAGIGFERAYPDAAASPELLRHERQENTARLKLTAIGQGDSAWSFWVDWYDFKETKLFRQPGRDYEYANTQWDFAAEHLRTLRDRHRLRFVAHWIRQDASSLGFNAHDYDRQEFLGGAFYEFLWPSSGLMFAYALGLPDAEYASADTSRNFSIDEYTDKLILGWRYHFSADARILLSVSQELSQQGFGGGNLQLQVFF